MTGYKELAQKDSCFRPGSTLCPGCMEATTFQNVGRVTDNGKKTVFTIGTSCAEVSTLAYPDVVAWGRGDAPPDTFGKSFSILHNVFESAPTLAEAVRDVSDTLIEYGALNEPIQVISTSGDGGALAIGLRALLSTIHRRARITILVLVNEIFANTGFQYSPATTPFAETSTTPVGPDVPGNLRPPLDYIHLAIAAGADLVAQVSPSYGKLFLRTMEKALAKEGTAVVFVPAPCISGWKFEDGQAIHIGELGAQVGVYPSFVWERGKGGEIKDCSIEAAERPALEEFLGTQRRFQHLVAKKSDGTPGYGPRPGREGDLARMKEWTQHNVERLYSLAQLK